MNKYIEITASDWCLLTDKNGYYAIDYGYVIDYFKNNLRHHEYEAAVKYGDGMKNYYLNDNYYGSNRARNTKYIPSDEYWAKLVKLRAFI